MIEERIGRKHASLGGLTYGHNVNAGDAVSGVLSCEVGPGPYTSAVTVAPDTQLFHSNWYERSTHCWPASSNAGGPSGTVKQFEKYYADKSMSTTSVERVMGDR